MTLAQALIGEHVSPRERGRFSGYFATVFALASNARTIDDARCECRSAVTDLAPIDVLRPRIDNAGASA